MATGLHYLGHYLLQLGVEDKFQKQRLLPSLIQACVHLWANASNARQRLEQARANAVAGRRAVTAPHGAGIAWTSVQTTF